MTDIEFLASETREAWRLHEKERKHQVYEKQKQTGKHRTFLIPNDLDKKLKDEANKRGISIAEMARVCLITSLNLWK